MSALELIKAECERHSAEGWTPEHDDVHTCGELATAAECYLLELRARMLRGQVVRSAPPAWPWNEIFWKPTEDMVKQLTKAGSLIVAEIERIQRLENKDGGAA